MEVNKITFAPDYSGDVVLQLVQDGNNVTVSVVQNHAGTEPGGHIDFGEVISVTPAGGHCEFHKLICSAGLGVDMDGQVIKTNY